MSNDKLRKLTLWDCINWYAAAHGTEHEREQRKVLDQAIDAALADTADAPPKVTEEMVAAGAARLHIRWGYIFFHETAELSNEATQDILRAALAAAQKGG